MAGGEPAAAAEAVRIDWCPVTRVTALQELIDTHWQRGHVLARDETLLRWQYPRAEDPDRLSVLLAEEADLPVGMLGIIPFGFGVKGRRLSGAWLTMWLTVPERRGQRAGLRLLQRALTGEYDMVGTLGFNERTRGVYQALRFHVRRQVPRWVRVVSPEALGALPGEAAEPYPVEARTAWAATARRPVLSTPAASVRLLPWSDQTAARWDQSWKEKFAPQLVGTWRDSSYLRWRVCSITPGFTMSFASRKTGPTEQSRAWLCIALRQ